MGWFCGVEGCYEVAKYLRVMTLADGERIEFSLCEKHNKSKWTEEKKEVNQCKTEIS